MLKEFVEHLQNTAQPKLEKIGASTFAIFPGGGMWKLHARETVKKFLEDALDGEIADGRVYIAL